MSEIPRPSSGHKPTNPEQSGYSAPMAEHALETAALSGSRDSLLTTTPSLLATTPSYFGEGSTLDNLNRNAERIRQERERRSRAFDSWITQAFDRAVHESPGSDTPKTAEQPAHSLGSKEWRSFDSTPVARAFVFRMIQDSKGGGKSDKDIYREASIALHNARLSGGNDQEIEQKEKILRTLYDKKEEAFKL